MRTRDVGILRKARRAPSAKRFTLIAGVAASLLAGCAGAEPTVGVARSATTGLAARERVAVVLVGRNYSPYQPRGGPSSRVEFVSELEQDVVRCISRPLREAVPGVEIVPPEVFRRTAFPDMTPTDVPPRSWERLVHEPEFRARIAPLGLRYLISVSVSKRQTPMEFDVTYGERGLTYGWMGEGWTSASAAVVDLKHMRVAGSATASAAGDRVVGIGFLAADRIVLPIPIWVVSFTDEQSCTALGKTVAAFLTKDAPQPEDRGLAATALTMAEMFRAEGRYAAAEPLYRRALFVMEAALAPDHPDALHALDSLAGMYDEQARYAEAAPLYERALAIRERTFGPDHPSVATNLNKLAVVHMAQGRHAEAEALLERAVALDEKVLGPGHPMSATTLNNLAELYREQGRFAEAAPLYEQAIAIWDDSLRRDIFPPPDMPTMVASLNTLARLHDAQGRYADAESLHLRALETAERDLGPDHADVLQSLDNLADLYDRLGRYANADSLYERAAASYERSRTARDPDTRDALSAEAHRNTDAERLYARAIGLRETAFGPDHPGVVQSLETLANFYHAQGRPAEAAPYFERALAIREETFAAEPEDVIASLDNLAAIYRAQGRYGEAERLYKRGLAMVERSLGPNHPGVARRLKRLVELYDAQRRYSDADALYWRALAIYEKPLVPKRTDVALADAVKLYGAESTSPTIEPPPVRALAMARDAPEPQPVPPAYIGEILASLR